MSVTARSLHTIPLWLPAPTQPLFLPPGRAPSPDFSSSLGENLPAHFDSLSEEPLVTSGHPASKGTLGEQAESDGARGDQVPCVRAQPALKGEG